MAGLDITLKSQRGRRGKHLSGGKTSGMDKIHYDEMTEKLHMLIQQKLLQDKKIFLFGHCSATEELAKLLSENGFSVEAVLDNNESKHGKEFRGIPIQPPSCILVQKPEKTAVCIAARAYAEMAAQLASLGYGENVYKMADYNSYAEYSLSEDTIRRKLERVEKGISLLQEFKEKYPGYFRILCPFSALGDVYYAMSYLPYFMEKRRIEKCVTGVVGRACGAVADIFGGCKGEVFSQEDMDCIVQAAVYTGDRESFIAHQDRPYAVKLHKALYYKCIPLEQIYRCGVFGLPNETKGRKPCRLHKYGGLEQIREGQAVIFSPYAKSVTELPYTLWEEIVNSYLEEGYQCFTNVAGEERPLAGTLPISPAISEIQSAAERAGLFIGIRSGLCDVLKEAKCRKAALYPDYNYCDTKWKAIDMYVLDGWENIVVKDGFRWKKI